MCIFVEWIVVGILMNASSANAMAIQYGTFVVRLFGYYKKEGAVIQPELLAGIGRFLCKYINNLILIFLKIDFCQIVESFTLEQVHSCT